MQFGNRKPYGLSPMTAASGTLARPKGQGAAAGGSPEEFESAMIGLMSPLQLAPFSSRDLQTGNLSDARGEGVIGYFPLCVLAPEDVGGEFTVQGWAGRIRCPDSSGEEGNPYGTPGGQGHGCGLIIGRRNDLPGELRKLAFADSAIGGGGTGSSGQLVRGPAFAPFMTADDPSSGAVQYSRFVYSRPFPNGDIVEPKTARVEAWGIRDTPLGLRVSHGDALVIAVGIDWDAFIAPAGDGASFNAFLHGEAVLAVRSSSSRFTNVE